MLKRTERGGSLRLSVVAARKIVRLEIENDARDDGGVGRCDNSDDRGVGSSWQKELEMMQPRGRWRSCCGSAKMLDGTVGGAVAVGSSSVVPGMPYDLRSPSSFVFLFSFILVMGLGDADKDQRGPRAWRSTRFCSGVG